MKILIKPLAFALLTLVVLLVIAIIRTILFFPTPKDIESCPELHEPIKGQPIVERFRSALKFKTITKGIHNYDTIELKKYIDFIVKSNLFVKINKFLLKLILFENRLSETTFVSIRFL